MTSVSDDHIEFAMAERALLERSPSVGRFTVSGDRPGSLKSIGSAFVARIGTALHLVTAGHVVRDLKNELQRTDGILTLRFGSVSLILWRAQFRLDPVADIATMPFDLDALLNLRRKFAEPIIGALSEADFAKTLLHSVPTLSQPICKQYFLAGFLGFPASRNTVHPHAGSSNNPFLQALMLEPRSSKIPDQITFAFERKNLRNLSKGKQKMSAPDPHGMSGGPVYWLTRSEDGFRTELCGIAVEYHVRENLLGAVPLDGLIVRSD